VHEFGRRSDLGEGPDRPVAVVEVERRPEIGQVDVGFPLGVDRPDPSSYSKTGHGIIA
jgi:hypothetical protein